MSSSQTFPKYWSKFSTKRWINWIGFCVPLNEAISYRLHRCRLQSTDPDIFYRLSWSCGTRLSDEVLRWSQFAWNHGRLSFCGFKIVVLVFHFRRSWWTTLRDGFDLFCSGARWIWSEWLKNYHFKSGNQFKNNINMTHIIKNMLRK